MNRRAIVDLVEVNDYLYVALPSQRRAFRQEMAEIGLPFSWEWVQHAYRIPAHQRATLEELLGRYYPEWDWCEWGWRDWEEIPIWARGGIEHFRSQSRQAFKKEEP